MDNDLVITFERYLKGNRLVQRVIISEAAIESSSGVESLLVMTTRDMWKKFSYEYEMEKENLRFAPKTKADKMIYDTTEDRFYRESDRFRV